MSHSSLLIETSDVKKIQKSIHSRHQCICIAVTIACVVLLITSLIIYFLILERAKEIKCNVDRDSLVEISIPNTGNVYGIKTHTSYEFLGIQYANITKRWTRANDLYNISFSNNEYCANSFGSCCMQITNNINLNGKISEQCLFLNIYTPNNIHNHTDDTQLYDVYLWVHGGAGIWGCSTQSIPLIYNGTNMINTNKNKNIIIVTVNYRLDILSYLYLNELNNESYNNYPSSANYNVLDIISALKWVYHNIIHFKGNPESITLFGQSFGARILSLFPIISDNTSLGTISHMYKSIILQSGSGFINSFYENSTNALNKSYKLSKQIGCDVDNINIHILDCLRNINITAFIELVSNENLYDPHKIVIDNYLFNSYPDNIAKMNEYNNVTILIGHNIPDGFPICYEYSNLSYNESLTVMESRLDLLGIPSEYFVDIRLLYNLTAQINNYCEILTLILLDASYVCPSRRLLNYSYVFNQQLMNYWYQIESCNNYNMECPKQPILSVNNVCGHTYEICYVFGTVSSVYDVHQSANCGNVNAWGNDILSSGLSEFIVDVWTITDTERGNIIVNSFNSDNPMYYIINPYLIVNSSNRTNMKQFDRSEQCDFYDFINNQLNIEAFGI
eukprot:441689_1